MAGFKLNLRQQLGQFLYVADGTGCSVIVKSEKQ